MSDAATAKASSASEWLDDIVAGLVAYYLTSLPVVLGVWSGVSFLNRGGPGDDPVAACVRFDAVHYVNIILNGYSRISLLSSIPPGPLSTHLDIKYSQTHDTIRVPIRTTRTGGVSVVPCTVFLSPTGANGLSKSSIVLVKNNCVEKTLGRILEIRSVPGLDVNELPSTSTMFKRLRVIATSNRLSPVDGEVVVVLENMTKPLSFRVVTLIENGRE
jgi:hypothetical protein